MDVGGTWTEHDRVQWHSDRVQVEFERQEQYIVAMSSRRKPPPRPPPRDSHDLHSSSLEQTTDIMTLFQHALDRIPQSQKASFLLAKEIVPDLVQSESPPMRFLKVCQAFSPKKQRWHTLTSLLFDLTAL